LSTGNGWDGIWKYHTATSYPVYHFSVEPVQLFKVPLNNPSIKENQTISFSSGLNCLLVTCMIDSMVAWFLCYSVILLKWTHSTGLKDSER
jgi:hypothetical protein